ncbi:uncharacterized protein FOMMEDRAFT_27143 [Fomitiporia mediterranea MF3/22]|uniref:uncharacterized protein n=1 Tax=Fomitiporia mediterranea (strain MF3/22) TaxID=694068 RepID=UPI0004409ABE|nr:uncharacterized protein FOMMEDRAFT_27143 [Fomitiporia mediterranea MF3/22]EJD04845.1 hypothetical protein FOMMEDRAFT_27143 [Fomitiporia mediterranea MF3/22]
MPSSILNLKFKGNKSFVAFSNLGDSDALTKTWKVCTKVASYLEQGQRLENLSWRLWHLQTVIVDTDNAKSKREFKKLSKNMGDKLDKEKGRAIEELEAPDFKLNQAAEKLRQRAEERERSRYESATQGSGRPLKRMQFTFAVDQPAGSFHDAPGPLSGVRKPDLKPSSQFRDTVHRRRPATRASAAHAENDQGQSTHAQDKEYEKDPPSLTDLGRKPTPPPDFSPDTNSYAQWSHDSNSVADNNHSATIRFPTLFTSDFGPSALLFTQPSLVTSLSYGEDAATVRDREAFQIARPTIELPLDEILKEMSRAEYEREPQSPDEWSSPQSNSAIDIDMKNVLDTQENLPSTIHPAQVSSNTVSTPTPSVGGRSGKPSLTVRTSSSRSNPLSASVTSATASTSRNSDGSGSTAPGGVKAECSNCGATHTPLWRRGLNDELNCNACGLYCKLHKKPRPKSMRNQHGEGRQQSAPRNDNSDAMGEPVLINWFTKISAQCYNCHTTTTPLWRKDDEGKTVCNACGLYFKLHGSSRPISMKSDIIRKRSRHDARRVGSGETPSASPGASRRPSPSSGGSGERQSPTLAPDSSTAQPAYSFSPEDYDFASSASAGVNTSDFGTGGMGIGTASIFSSNGHYDTSNLMFSQPSFPGPYHPDYLQRPFIFGEDGNGNYNSNVQHGQDEEDRMSKRRRMSIDSASEPPSSTTSYSSYPTEASSATTASRSSFDFGLGYGSGSGASTFGYSFSSSSGGSLRAQDAYWHPPMMPQQPDKSPAFPVHPPMLPSEDTSMTVSGGHKDFPMDFLHPPMMSNNINASGGREDERDFLSSYLHPPMVANGDDSPMSQLSALHPPMKTSHDNYYSQHQRQDQQQHNSYQQHQAQQAYHQRQAEQQQQHEQNVARSYRQQLKDEHEQRQQQRFYEQYGLSGLGSSHWRRDY